MSNVTDPKIHEILNGARDYARYEFDPNELNTLEGIEQFAQEGLFNGPEGCEMILRLIEIIRTIRRDESELKTNQRNENQSKE